MKLIYITVLMLVTTFAYTQNSQSEIHTKHTNSLLIENFRNRNVTENQGSSPICSEMKTNSDALMKPISISLMALLDSVYEWTWDVHSTGWNLKMRSIDIHYSTNNLQTSYTEQMLSNNLWVNYAKHQYNVNLVGNLESYIELRWEDNKWVNFSKITNTFNLKNDPLNILEQNWNVNVWKNVSSTDYSYDANNYITTELLKKWDGTKWENNTKALYTYDLSNILTSITIQGFSDTWINVIKGDFTYNTDNMITNEFDYIWDGINWINYAWYNYKYDENNKRTKELIKIWVNTIWDNYERSNFTYDANNNMTFLLSERSFEADWLTYSQIACEYDANNFMTNQSNKLWDVTGTNIISGEKNSYYFHTAPSGKTDQEIDKIIVFPNPSNGKFVINILPPNSSIEIYKLNGERIYANIESKKQAEEVIDLSRYPAGVYLIKVRIGSEIYCRSLIIQ